MLLSLECRDCGSFFDGEIGKVSFRQEDNFPIFEVNPICPKCGERTTSDVFLTELGQSQLTEAYMYSR